MFEIHCPTCNAEGRTSRDKINTRLVCRKCFKAFHITPTGRAVPGVPPQSGEVTSQTPFETVAPDRAQEVDEWFERISRTVFSPRTALILGGLIVLVIGSTMYSRGETLQDRAMKAARAAYDKDTSILQSLATGDSGNEVLKWNDAVQVQLEMLRKSLGDMSPSISVEIRKQDSSEGTAEVVARVSTEQDLERRGLSLPDPALTIVSGVKIVELPLRFRTETFKGWRLDGKQTLEAAPGM